MKKFLKITAVIILILAACAVGGYFAGKYAFNRYFTNWGTQLVELERQGLLSAEYGAGWQDVLADKAMELVAQSILDTAAIGGGGQSAAATPAADFPSLAVVRLLNEVREYSNTILITDRNNHAITRINTNHHRARIDEFPQTLITALVAAEDQNFFENDLGFEFDSFVRASLRSIPRFVQNRGNTMPRGTSTITQQVAKLLLSRLDEAGQRRVSNTVERKTRELKLAAALRQMYTPNEILEVYMNHAVTSDFGLVGYKDIARGLLGKELHELTDAECVYLARMVKWGRNVRPRIVAQSRIDMPRMGDALGWSESRREAVLREVEELTFRRPRRIEGEHGPLVDLANEYWLATLRRNGSTPAQLASMDIIDPSSLVRRKGNLTIRLTIDLPLQRELERLVGERGYGGDTVITTEVRIGSFGENISAARAPRDTIRHARVLRREETFAEPGSMYVTALAAGDTVIENIRYSRVGGGGGSPQRFLLRAQTAPR